MNYIRVQLRRGEGRQRDRAKEDRATYLPIFSNINTEMMAIAALLGENEINVTRRRRRGPTSIRRP